MTYVYVISNQAGQLYTGCTGDLKKRISEHNSGKGSYTRGKGPYEIIYYEACLDRRDAYAREKYLKSGMGKRYLHNRVKYYLNETNMNPVRTQKTTKSHLMSEASTEVRPLSVGGKGSEF